ncbi:MAG: class I SAM-dependent methyltransferase [Chloroflexota bacterium]
MHTFEQVFAPISARRILDVATGAGGFIQALMETLQSYTEIIGIDASERFAAVFAETFAEKPVRFVNMDAARLDFPDGHFDMVCIANSLHHLEKPEEVLAEMLRVLRPGGWFVVSEMYRDDQSEAQLTHVLMHDWWGAVDTARGVTHRETYPRQAIVGIVQDLGLAHCDFYDIAYLDEDPRAPELAQHLNGVIDQYLQRAEGLPGQDELQQRGQELRQRVQVHGFHGATSLLALGKR